MVGHEQRSQRAAVVREHGTADIDSPADHPGRALARQRTVDEVEIPGADGYFGVLPGHASLRCRRGEPYRKEREKVYFAIRSASREVQPDRVTILASSEKAGRDRRRARRGGESGPEVSCKRRRRRRPPTPSARDRADEGADPPAGLQSRIRSWLFANLHNLFRYRGLIQSLSRASSRYRGSRSFFWPFINPLLLLLVYRSSSPSENTGPQRRAAHALRHPAVDLVLVVVTEAAGSSRAAT
jgi:hypothetical protein